MMNAPGTILDRAIRSWEEAGVAFLYPVLGEPEQYELSRRIAEDYPGYFDDELFALLSSPNPVVVAQALATLGWMKSPVLAELPKQLLLDERRVSIAGCLLASKSLGGIARQCAKQTR